MDGNFFRVSIFLSSDFDSIIILKLFLNIKGVPSPKNLRNIFQSLLMVCYIIKTEQQSIFCIENAKNI